MRILPCSVLAFALVVALPTARAQQAAPFRPAKAAVEAAQAERLSGDQALRTRRAAKHAEWQRSLEALKARFAAMRSQGVPSDAAARLRAAQAGARRPGARPASGPVNRPGARPARPAPAKERATRPRAPAPRGRTAPASSGTRQGRAPAPQGSGRSPR